MTSSAAVFITMLISTCLAATYAADPDSVKDFCIPSPSSNNLHQSCKEPASVQGNEFVSQILRNNTNMQQPSPGTFVSAFVSVSNFPALNTMGLSIARADIGIGGAVPLHAHPRSSELVYLEKGSAQIGFVDTNNTLYMNTLHKGDIMIIPRGLIHFLVNVGRSKATVLVVFNSQEPGAQFLGPSLFGSGIPSQAIQVSLSLNQTTIDALRGIFSP